MIDHFDDSPRYKTMTNLLSPSSTSSSSSSSSSPSITTTYSNHHDLHCPSSSVYQHQSSEVIISSHRSSTLNHSAKTANVNGEQTDSDADLDSSSSSSCVTHSSKLKKRRANLPKDSVRKQIKPKFC